MTELGQLEKHYQDFANRRTRVIAISVEDQEAARQTQNDFPHLLIVADSQRKFCEKFQFIHPGAAPGGKDTATPTTILVDGQGTVRWLYRSERVFSRLSPDELLAAVDEHLLGR
jgi:peroxiredoxin